MNLASMLEIKCWSSLYAIFPSAKQVCEEIYEICDDLYVKALPYDASLNEGVQGFPFVTIIYWAMSVDAIKRVALGNSIYCLDKENITKSPPDLLLSNTGGTYSGLTGVIKKSKIKDAEVGTYSNNGVFIHREIGLGRFKYYFIRREQSDGEIPYVIGVELQ
jgi:hypothetical protein